MGMFDWVTVTHPAFVCPAGHDLRGQEFQTKDFDCVLGHVHIGELDVGFEPGILGSSPEEKPFTGTVNVYSGCPECAPDNSWQAWCEFAVEVEADKVRSIRRVEEAP